MDLEHDSWDVIENLKRSMEWHGKAKEQADEARAKLAKLDESVAGIAADIDHDIAVIQHRLLTAGKDSISHGGIAVARPDGVPVLFRPCDPFDLDLAYEAATGIRPGRKSDDPADVVDLTQPIHEAVTAPSAN